MYWNRINRHFGILREEISGNGISTIGKCEFTILQNEMVWYTCKDSIYYIAFGKTRKRWKHFFTWQHSCDKSVADMFVICVNHSSSCRAANAGVFILNDLLPLNRLPLNKAHAIILSSCLTVSIEGVGGKVLGGGSPQLYYHDCSGPIPGRLREVRQRLQLGGFSLQ